jgi:hypothetical protein
MAKKTAPNFCCPQSLLFIKNKDLTLLLVVLRFISSSDRAAQ